MGEFELKLGNTTYKCSGYQQDKENQNWNVTSEHEGIRVNINVPIDKKIHRIQVILFVEAFHVAFTQAIRDQKI